MNGTAQEKAWLKSKENAEKILAKVDVDKNELELRIKKLASAIDILKDENSKNNSVVENTTPSNDSVMGSKELEKVRSEAKSKVLNSEFIQDKTKYFKRIKEATTVEVLKVLISEIEKLNSNEGIESKPEENISETTEQLKTKLQTLVDNNLIKTEKYTQATPELQTEYRKARAFARKLLNEDTSKEKLQEQIKVLETVIKKITG